MSYGDYDLVEILRQFELMLTQSSLFSAVPRREPTPWLRDTLLRGKPLALYSEKSRSEFIVTPILLTCRELFGEQCAIYSGIRLDVDGEKGLRDECDFILARTAQTPVLRAPVLVVVEAKKNDIEVGLGQCAAQMIAARQFNESHKTPIAHVHGCVTTGEDWQFLRLDDNNLIVDDDRYYINDVDKILGILLAIMSERL